MFIFSHLSDKVIFADLILDWVGLNLVAFLFWELWIIKLYCIFYCEKYTWGLLWNDRLQYLLTFVSLKKYTVNMVIFAGVKFLRKCWQDISYGGNFHDTTPISFIKVYGFYFREKRQKRVNYRHAKISTLTVVARKEELLIQTAELNSI